MMKIYLPQKHNFFQFKWNAIFSFEYFIKKKKKTLPLDYILAFCKKIKNQYLILEKKLLEISIFNSLLSETVDKTWNRFTLYQETIFSINDIYSYSKFHKIQLSILKAIKLRFNVYVNLNLGSGKIFLFSIFLLENSWKKEKYISIIPKCHSIFLSISKNKEYILQIFELNFKVKLLFNFVIKSDNTILNPIYLRSYCILVNNFNATMFHNLLDDVQYVVIDYSEYDDKIDNIFKIKKLLLKFCNKKFQIVYLKEKTFFEKYRYKPFLLSYNFELKEKGNANFYSTEHFLEIFENSFLKINKLLEYIFKKETNFIIFLKSESKCTLLSKIINKYLKNKRCSFPIYVKINSMKTFNLNRRLAKVILLINDINTIMDTGFLNFKYIINYENSRNMKFYIKNSNNTRFIFSFFSKNESIFYRKIFAKLFGLRLNYVKKRCIN
nr:hypothetical protein 1634Bnrm1_p017 [Cryptomonas sp.]